MPDESGFRLSCIFYSAPGPHRLTGKGAEEWAALPC